MFYKISKKANLSKMSVSVDQIFLGIITINFMCYVFALVMHYLFYSGSKTDLKIKIINKYHLF